MLERATGAPVSVGGGRWSTAATRWRRSRPSTATAKETLVEAQHRADHHQTVAGERQPGAGAEVLLADATGGGSSSWSATSTKAAPTIQGTTAPVDVVHVRGQQPDGGRRRGDASAARSTSVSSNTSHALNVAVPVEEQADQEHERAQGQHERPDVESAGQRSPSLTSGRRRIDQHAPSHSILVLNLTRARFWLCGVGISVSRRSAFVSRPGADSPLLYRAGGSPTRPARPASPLRGHQRRRRLTEVLPQHSRPVALQPPHERGVVGCHPLGAPERLELGQEQLQLAVERGVRGLDARAVGGRDDRAVQLGVRLVDRAPGAVPRTRARAPPARRARSAGSRPRGARARAAPPRPRARSAARRAATISSAVSRATRAPRLVSIRTSPSAASARSAARSEWRATP